MVYANMTGVLRWDPCYHQYSVHGSYGSNHLRKSTVRWFLVNSFVGYSGVGKCPILGILDITFKYLLEIISPILGWCEKLGHLMTPVIWRGPYAAGASGGPVRGRRSVGRGENQRRPRLGAGEPWRAMKHAGKSDENGSLHHGKGWTMRLKWV